MKPKLVVLYDYFFPAFKAGGPIQSITNLIKNIYDNFEIYVITSNLELGSNQILNVLPDIFNDFENGKAKVIYLSKAKRNISSIVNLIYSINPDKIFVNGIYSIKYSIVPSFYFPDKTILHVRGMLHPGALEQKKIKKKLFLAFFKLLKLHKTIQFCVSDEKEKFYTQAIFGTKTRINIAKNFPANFDLLPTQKKEIGNLKLISVALVSPIKNHLLVLEALTMVKSSITWHIYGPIKDKEYWVNCNRKISFLSPNIKVKYMGVINPNQVYETLKSYHMFVLPSQSENFGHALFEAMMAGKPIITSNNTPWNLLDENNAGYNVKLTSFEISIAIESAALLNQFDYNKKVDSVAKYAKNALNINEIKNQYLSLFN